MRATSRILGSLIVTLALTAILAPAVQAAPAETRDLDLTTLPDAALLDQRGEPVQLAALVSEGPVAIQFIFTSCSTICSPMGAIFGRLQESLPDGARLLSVSVDPVRDTPERLRAWAARFGAGERWTQLTGDKKEIDDLLKALGVFTPTIEEHAPVVLLGNPATGRWRRANGLSSPQVLAQELAALVDGAGQPEPAVDAQEAGGSPAGASMPPCHGEGAEGHGEEAGHPSGADSAGSSPVPSPAPSPHSGR
jgi:protein SCO1/2